MAHRHHRHRNHGDDSGLGCGVILILGLLAMPLVGLYMLITGKDDDTKTIGLLLMAVGLIIWFAVAAQG